MTSPVSSVNDVVNTRSTDLNRSCGGRQLYGLNCSQFSAPHGSHTAAFINTQLGIWCARERELSRGIVQRQGMQHLPLLNVNAKPQQQAQEHHQTN